MPTITRASLTDRAQLALTTRGIISEAFPIVGTTAFSASATQKLYAVLSGFRAGDVVTNLSVMLGGAGVTVTLFKVGIYDTAGNKLAGSADVSGSLVASVINTFALTAPYTIPADGGYYLAFLAVSAATVPTVATSAVAAQYGTPVGSGFRFSVAQAAQSDLPTTATWSGNSNPPWMAAS